jgi:hypothetical protein
MPFRNSEAGRRLAVALAGYKEQEPTILALPRGWRDKAAQLGLKEHNGEIRETKGGLAALWGNRPVTAITTKDIADLIRDARRVGIPGPQRRNKEGEQRSRPRPPQLPVRVL